MLMKKNKTALTISTLIPLGFYIYLLYTQAFNESVFFFAYNAIVVFTLPFLIARLSACKEKFYYHSMIFFLIYPVTYLLAYMITKITPLNLDALIHIISILIIFKWHSILAILITRLPTEEIKNILRQGLYIVPLLLIYAAAILLIRDPNSVVALDYLQHYAVSTRMASGDILCIIPNQCSELFIQVGYTTIYHTILGFLTAFSNENPLNAIFLIDLIYPLLVGLLTFGLLKKFSRNIFFVAILALSTLFIFVNGAYESIFFLPQTLAFIFFLMALNIKNLSKKKLLTVGLIMILTHFIMGTYLFILLLGKYIIVDKLPQKTVKIFHKYILAFAILTPGLLLIANSSGFSIESAFQGGATEIIGGVTNMPFPQNIWNYLSIWGGTAIFVFFSIIFRKDKTNKWYLYSVMYISIGLSIFLLEPTYATKFLIGEGLFSIILILGYLKDLQDKKIKILATLLILISLFPAYYFNKLDYLEFYKQDTGIANAVSNKDKKLLQFAQATEANCIFVSDPLTQILVESLGEQRTARAQYITPESRKQIFEFIQDPKEDTYENLRDIEELKKRNMCFIYSSRLNTSLEKEDVFWIFHMYSIIIDNSIELDDTDKLRKFMLDKSYEINYEDNHFIVFSKN